MKITQAFPAMFAAQIDAGESGQLRFDDIENQPAGRLSSLYNVFFNRLFRDAGLDFQAAGHLTKDYGHPALKEHLSNVIFLMRSCATDTEFKHRLDAAAPKHGETAMLPLASSN